MHWLGKDGEKINDKRYNLLQLADLLVGCVALEANSRRTKTEKYDLINFIKNNKKLQKLSDNNWRHSWKIWRFDYDRSNKPKSQRWNGFDFSD